MNRHWELTPASFDRLLLALDPDRERAAEEYEKLRFKLTKFFEWRGCLTPDEYADRTIDRLARRIDAGEQIGQVYSYCCAIARLLLLEAQRQDHKEAAALKHLSSLLKSAPDADEAAIPAEIFERCLERLPPESRALVLAYYQEEKQAKIERRRQLADRLGIPLNALRLRAHRIRVRLQECVERHGFKISATQKREES